MSGHTDKVTCVVVSQGYSVIVSGSADCTCIIWDLNKLTFVGQLKLDAPVVHIAINEISGNIKAVTENTIYVWDINGQLLIRKTVCTNPAEFITCCVLSKASEWLDINVLITGHKDGTIKVLILDIFLLQLYLILKLMTFFFKKIISFWSIAYEEIDDGKNQVLNLTLRIPLQGDTAAITCLHISTDQKKLFSGDSSGKVLCWQGLLQKSNNFSIIIIYIYI